MTKAKGGGQRLTATIQEAAIKLGVGKNQAYEAARRGEIPTIRIGKRILVPLIALEALLRGRAAGSQIFGREGGDRASA